MRCTIASLPPRLAAAGVLILTACLNGYAEPDKPAKPIEVGQKAPAFSLKDQAGETRSLDDLRKKGPVALVFYRSAKW